MPSLQANFVARIEKLPIKREMAGLLPVFEAISNSFHAIQALFKSEDAAKGQIDIEVIRENSEKNAPIDGFIIKDNGIGLTEDNYQSFLSIDSIYKANIGGKGVGRLCWLKIFKTLHIESAYFDPISDELKTRSFDFLLQEKDQIRDTQPKYDLKKPSTIISLKGYKPSYTSVCPVKGSTIRENILKHFFHYFLYPAPKVYVKDINGNSILNDEFNQLIKTKKEEDITFKTVKSNDADQIEEETHTLRVRHILMSKYFRPNQKGNSKFNRIFLTAHNRVVLDDFIDNALGLTILQDDNIYICCVSGNYLDENVNSERTGFIFDEAIKKEINKTVLETSKIFLASDLEKLKNETRRIIKDEIVDSPQFNFINNYIDDFMENIKPGKIDKEDIYVEMCRYKRRLAKQMSRLKTEIYDSNLETDKAINEKIQKYSNFINDQQKGLLAEYILKRKSVLDLLDQYSGYQNNTEKHYYEEMLHSLVMPMKKNSTEIDYDQHNLWIIDDRLAFFSYFCSDNLISDYTDTKSKDRPDIILFYENCYLWAEESNNTVVLIEFKRPGRDDYKRGEKNDPLFQICKYIKTIQEGKLKLPSGKIMPASLKKAAFHVYLIADLTPTLLDNIFSSIKLTETPDKEGLYGYTFNPDAFIEIISYNKLLSDAKKRNSIFFNKIGLTNID